MSNAAKLKKKAVELEQKKQFDKALSLYIQFLQESEGTLDDVDIPINNRVGDLLLRTGNTADALNYYEKAVDLYADRGFHNNAIALCNKVLRQSPGRASIYYKLGKISATKGFKSDAKKNFLEYADRMQKVGQIDEAFRALKEFADLCPDQDDIRLMLAEQLTKQNRQDEAMEQLQKLHDKLDSEGRMAEARATVDRMKSIDPEAVPRVSGSYRPQKSQDLIFLDTSFEQASRTRQSEPAAPPLTPARPARPATPAPPPPAGRQVSDPDLVVLTLGDQHDTPVSPVHNAAVANAFDLEVDAPVDDATASSALPMLDLPDAIDTPPNTGASLELNAKQDPAPVDLAAEEPSYASGPRLGIDYASDLAADVIMPPESSDLFDFRAPPRSDDSGRSATPVPGLDPDVAFPSFDLDTALPSADEITSGASLAAALDPVDTLGIELGGFDSDSAERLDPNGMAGGSDVASSLDLEWPTSDDATTPAAATPTIDIEGLELGSPVPVSSAAPLADALDMAEIVDAVADLPGHSDIDGTATPNANAPTGDYPRVTGDVEIVASIPVAADSPEPEPDRRAGWEVQRAHAERLLEAGDRAGGVHELEQVAAELERIGDLERALSIVDELIRLSPDSVRHHQKRVELAFRSNDRVKLIDAYLELGDALFRSGEERKARAVYQRVLELAPDDPRAQAAVESVASASPPTGSGAISAIPTSPAERPQSGPRPPEKHVAYQSVPSNGARPTGGGVTAPPPSRKPSPLDRSDAAHGEFVDLGDWLRSGENPKSTRMVAEEKPPSGDEQADFQEMLKRFKQGVAENVDEEDYESHYDLGVAFKEMGLVDEAVAEFQKALRGSSNRVRACEALGQCFVEKEQFHVAASVLSRAIALGEGDDHHLVGVLYLLGKATEALGKPNAALDYYQRVFAVDIEFRDVAERISAIERKAT